MRCLPRLRPSSNCMHACTAGSARPYSFSASIQNLLESFTATSPEPTTYSEVQKALSKFHENVRNPKIVTHHITRQYTFLQENSTLEALPRATAVPYLKRLLKARDTRHAIALLVEYDLDDAVSLAAGVFGTLPHFEREFCLFMLYRALLAENQKGLAVQILVQMGIVGQRSDAFQKLMRLQNQVKFATPAEIVSIKRSCMVAVKQLRMSDRSQLNLDPYTVLLLVKRLISMHEMEELQALCTCEWHAKDALKLYFTHLKEDELVQLMHAHASIPSCMESPVWPWVISRISIPSKLTFLADVSPATEDVQSAIAHNAARHVETQILSLQCAQRCDPDMISLLLFHWIEHLEPLDNSLQHRAGIERISAFLTSLDRPDFLKVVSTYLQQVSRTTSGQLQNYDFAHVTNFLSILEEVPQDLSPEIESSLQKNFVNRPSEQTLQFFRYQKTSRASIQALVGHLLATWRSFDREANPRCSKTPPELRWQCDHEQINGHQNNSVHSLAQSSPESISSAKKCDISASFFVSTISILKLDVQSTCPRFDQAELSIFHENILRNLLQLSSVRPALNFLRKTQKMGQKISPDLASYIMRVLSCDMTNSKHISRLFITLPPRVLTYDTYARYISRAAALEPRMAMTVLMIAMKKNIQPRRRVLQNLVLGISKNDQISESRAFTYITRVMKISRLFGLHPDRIYLASLLRVVLGRQGLGASTSRIAWLLTFSSILAKRRQIPPLLHRELLDVIQNWSAYERTHGGIGDKRPRKLREILDTMSARKSVTGRRQLKETIPEE